MKKLNGLVFYSFKNHKKGYIEMLFERLHKVALKKGLQLHRGSLKDIHIMITDNNLSISESLTGKPLDYFNIVYFELWYKAQSQALAAAKYLRRKNIPFISEELENLIPMTKVGELSVLSDNDIPLPDTFTSSHNQILKAFKQNPPLEYPIIVKAEDGYGGKNNFLIRNYKELTAVLKANKDLTFILQEFIPNDYDYRCIVLGGKIKVVLRRQRSDEGHLNNTSKGASGEICKLSELTTEMQNDVLKASSLLGRSSFAGVDLLVSNNGSGHYILEVNQTPQIEIGSNVDVKIDAMTEYLKETAI